MKTQVFPMLALASMAAGCANSGANYTPIVDGPKTPAFQSDLVACQSLAKNQRHLDQETMAAAVLGGGAGAALAALDEDNNEGAEIVGGLVIGAATGGVAGAVSASERRENIVIECMKGRGHRVVG